MHGHACSLALAQIIRAARKNGELDSFLDVPRAVAELAGPLAYQTLPGRKTLTRSFVKVAASGCAAPGRQRLHDRLPWFPDVGHHALPLAGLALAGSGAGAGLAGNP
jgi:hypothetical protein